MILIPLCGLAGLAALRHGGANAQGSDSALPANAIADDTYFYGESPPVYPSPNITGTGSWSDALDRAKELVGKMTLEEKVSLTGGITPENGCSGFIPSVPRLDFPGICLQDAGNGVRRTEFVNSWPSGLHVGASWNKDLARKRASGMAGEYKAKGVNVMLGPVVGPVGRVVKSGRNWEGFSVDPYLSGALVHETVAAVQEGGVVASTKHFIANEQETNRNPAGDVASVSSNIDDRTMHELYLWAFQDAVHAGTGSIMCSYNRLNNSYGCANSKSQNGLLKTELGFQGWVVSDWNAQHAGVATALAGMDSAMPSGANFWGDHLVEAVKNGSVPEYRVDDMATRLLASWYQAGQDKGFPQPGSGMPADPSQPHKSIDARDPSSRPTLMQGAIEGHVLVKNTNNALPLKKPKLISIFGYSAKAPDKNNYESGFDAWSFGVQSADLTAVSAGFAGASDVNTEATARNGTIVSGGGSGATSQSRISAPFDALIQQAYDDDTQLYWDFQSQDPLVNPASDACLVFGNAWATEGYDRPSLQDDFTDGLVNNVASRCNNTVVVFHNAGVRLVDGFVDHPNVTAVLFAHLPGQDSGRATVSILYGRANPSGKLPYTVARREGDYGALLGPDRPAAEFALFPQSNFTEGVHVDYRRFDAQGIEPRYEFGFGLSYTTFEYADLRIRKSTGSGNGNATATGPYPTGPVRPGGPADLWDVLATVTATVRNTGARAGAEAAQLYLGIPDAGAPPRQLRGFAKPLVDASDAAAVEFALTRRDLSVWDVAAQRWRLPRGDFRVHVGSSSRRLHLNGTLTI